MNQVIMIGNLTADPSVKVAQSGTKVCTLRIAVNSGFGDNKRTDFFHVVAFGNRAETCEKYLSKGSKVCIRGSLKTDSYTNKDGNKVNTTDILAEEVEFLPSGSKGGNNNSAPKQTEIPQGFEAVNDSELPF